jgi:glutathione S-transferase
MPMKLYFNPVSSYSQKVLVALYEKGCAFEPVIVNLMDPKEIESYKKIYPVVKIPFVRIEDKSLDLAESSVIIEYLDRHFPGGTKLIPDDPELALQVRMQDRFFDLYINDAVTKILFDGFRPQGMNDAFGVQQARNRLDLMYAMFDQQMANRKWAVGETFSMADCAASPALFYARMLHPFEAYPNVTAYFNRLMERPTYQRVVKEAEPFLAMLARK